MTSHPRSLLSSSTHYTNSTLIFVSLSACYLIWGLSLRNGTVKRMWDIRHPSTGQPMLPDINGPEPLKLSFTGIWPVDYFCTIMTVFFWEAVDGSHPDLSVVGLYFLPQAMGLLVPVWVEGLRNERGEKRVSYVNAWFFAMQSFSVGCIAPVYFATHLTSTRSTSSKDPQLRSQSAIQTIAQPSKLPILQFSVLLGYIVPAILMALPSPKPVSYTFQQNAIVLWVFFPIWVAGLQYLLPTLFPSTRKLTATRASYAYYTRTIYITTIAFCTMGHLSIISLSLASFLFPMLFAPAYTSVFHPTHLLFPSINASSSSIGSGVLNFLLWDQWAGFSAGLIWAFTLYRNAQRQSSFGLKAWVEVVAEIAVIGVIAGPGGAVLAVYWAREEILIERMDERLRQRRER